MPGQSVHVGDVFISHAGDDAECALEIARGLEGVGFSTWCFEIDSLPGVPYLLQIGRAIEGARALVLLISPRSLRSHQVTIEVVRAHECSRPFVPVLHGVSHQEFQEQQPEWRMALGASASVRFSGAHLESFVARLAEGLRSLGVQPSSSQRADRIARLSEELEDYQRATQHHAAPSTPAPQPPPTDPPASEAEMETLDATVVSATIATVGEDVAPQPPPASVTLVVRGPSEAARFVRFDVTEGRKILLGRSPSCDVTFRDPIVSRKHAVIWRNQRSEWEVKDLGSLGGTKLNGRAVETAVFTADDVIEIGGSSIQLAAGG